MRKAEGWQWNNAAKIKPVWLAAFIALQTLVQTIFQVVVDRQVPQIARATSHFAEDFHLNWRKVLFRMKSAFRNLLFSGISIWEICSVR